VSDKPAAIRNLSLLTASDVARITQRYRDRLASLLAVDDLVERVVNRLESTGILGDTVLIFTCDNGFFHGEHRIPGAKRKAYEEAVRVPLLIRGGGFPQGKTANQYVANIDLAPTIVDLAGASAGRVMDGRSLLPLARDSSVAPNRDILVETLTYQAVRNSSFLYVEHGTGEQELYDIRNGTPNYDPYQLQSRHAEQSYSQIKGQLATQLNGLRTCSGASCDPAPIPAAGSL
jgi:N-acetylglucosamine-6-sulfatase